MPSIRPNTIAWILGSAWATTVAFGTVTCYTTKTATCCAATGDTEICYDTSGNIIGACADTRAAGGPIPVTIPKPAGRGDMGKREPFSSGPPIGTCTYTDLACTGAPGGCTVVGVYTQSCSDTFPVGPPCFGAGSM